MNKCSCAALLVRANCATKTIMTDIKDSTYVMYNLKANNFTKAKEVWTYGWNTHNMHPVFCAFQSDNAMT